MWGRFWKSLASTEMAPRMATTWHNGQRTCAHSMQLCSVWSTTCKTANAIQCNNLSLVTALNKGSCKDKLVMQLLRILTFFVAHFDMHITSTHIAGTLNVSADRLSRFEMSSFFSSNPQATRQSTTLPQPLLQLLAATGPDWTSPLFRKLFSDILAIV